MLHIKYNDDLWKMTGKHFKNKQDREDAMQEIAIKLANLDMSFITNEKGWVVKVSSNLLHDLRKKWAAMRDNDKHAWMEDTIDTDCPLSCMERDEDFRNSLSLDDYLHMMPEAVQETAALYYKEDADYATISALLNIPVGTVASRLSTARSIIKGDL